MGWARRVDATQGPIVDALEAIGVSVFDASRVGTGFPDLVWGYRQVTGLLEVKVQGGKLNQKQVGFHTRWRGAPVIVACTPEEAVNGVLRAVKEARR